MTHCPYCGDTYICQGCGRSLLTKPEEILDILRTAIGPLYGTTIAERAYISKSRAYEILAAYVEAGIVTKVGGEGRRQGYKIVRRSAVMLPERELVA
jgi:DNA-binding IclR family transcriptional regulator